LHPRDAKMALAKEIVSAFFSDAEADAAQQNFITLFQKNDLPDEIPAFKAEGETGLLDVLVDSGLVKSKSQARRLVQQNGVKVDGETVSDPYLQLEPPVVVQVGKRRFVKVV
ncbi:MAG: S4 domain-containing protein, partial [Chloroflexota bacterium]|nr:S4 domain-containing protein [Chloroflexota bacterium]